MPCVLTSEQARERVNRRWMNDSKSLEQYIEKIVKRAPALTDEQRDRLAAALADTR